MKKIYLILTLSLTTFTSACMNLEITDISKLKDDHLLFVGRVMLDPPFDKREHKNCFGPMCTNVNLQIIDEYYEPSVTNEYKIAKNNYYVNTDDYFFMPYPVNKNAIILDIWFETSSTKVEILNKTTYRDMCVYENGIKLDYPKSAKAVYIGEFIIKRDEHFNLKGCEINQDGYEDAKKRFHEKFDTDIKLVKAGMSPANV